MLSDDAVVLRPWNSSDAIFMAEASRDPAIERYNGPSPASVADAITVIERIEQSWRTFEVEGDPSDSDRGRLMTSTAFARPGPIPRSRPARRFLQVGPSMLDGHSSIASGNASIPVRASASLFMLSTSIEQ